mmetsp:Transcript_27111/g.48930  ORF Transcript_27111/g.48930 Transcript_27111/m.48930 type:complete len:202 (-) Transcript_27111:2086-2691(-)
MNNNPQTRIRIIMCFPPPFYFFPVLPFFLAPPAALSFVVPSPPPCGFLTYFLFEGTAPFLDLALDALFVKPSFFVLFTFPLAPFALLLPPAVAPLTLVADGVAATTPLALPAVTPPFAVAFALLAAPPDVAAAPPPAEAAFVGTFFSEATPVIGFVVFSFGDGEDDAMVFFTLAAHELLSGSGFGSVCCCFDSVICCCCDC